MFYPSCIHTHTEFCDAHNTMEEMAESAFSKGFVSLGFSPHSHLPYPNNWAIASENYEKFFEKTEELREKYKNRMEIYKGVEWDTETEELPGGFDYVIGSVHAFVKEGEHFSMDYKKELLQGVLERHYHGDFLGLAEDYFPLVVKSALRPSVDVVGHMDLITKHNGTGELVDETHNLQYISLGKACIDAILKEKPDIYFEINTGVMARAGKKHPYPSAVFLKYLIEKGARLILDSDCHRAPYIDYGYEEVKKELLSYGCHRLYIFKENRFQSYDFKAKSKE